MECSVDLCAKTFHSMNITNGTFIAGPIREISLDAGREGSGGTWRGYGGKEWNFGLNTTGTTASSVPLPGNGTIILNSMDFQLLSEYIVDVFSSSTGTAFGNALRSSPNTTETIANVSTSITYAFGTAKTANQTLGFAVTTEQYIHVRWAWLTLSLAVVLMGVALLALTIVYSVRSGVTSWKSSSILPLFAQLDGWSEDYLRAATGPVKELERKAKMMCGVVEVDGDAGKVLFVNTARGTIEMRDV
ncbi:hypothetical protein DIS24_g11764 [Lasiodiplodia hormozganensis]|uniref:Uncharacterized protein n=1 Tax=Lasiodiplodia hormozganensis TaxID=869390 RepID=A0AA40BVT2_9PEZI|nr:hypothetical protein DIS24_g11764 [Lasiodiplodia hormozganensis]